MQHRESEKQAAYMPEHRQETPLYGVNYKRGYIGFVYPEEPGPLSRGVRYFTRLRTPCAAVPVSHCFIVASATECIEADHERGVVRTPLWNYFRGGYAVYFRRPLLYNAKIADRIVAAAVKELGKPYDKRLILAHAFLGTGFGHLVNRLFRRKPARVITRMLDRKHKWICSELCAHALQAAGLPICKTGRHPPPSQITPQELFASDFFRSWVGDRSETP